MVVVMPLNLNPESSLFSLLSIKYQTVNFLYNNVSHNDKVCHLDSSAGLVNALILKSVLTQQHLTFFVFVYAITYANEFRFVIALHQLA